jgi:hypothetical protein
MKWTWYLFKNIYCFIYVYILIPIFLVGCANIVAPSGGDKDISPPKIISANPPSKSINFNGKKIILVFDEYFKLKKNNINLSPICEPPPKINIKGKTIEINIECDLMDSTTYTINLSKSIVDLNEGNILNNYKYVFSTGAELDSLSIKGSVNELYNNKVANNVLIGLYQSTDSIKPYYYTFSNENGEFLIDNISKKDFILFAIKDENMNLKYDTGEMISLPEKIYDFSGNKNIGLFYEDLSNQIINVENIHRNSIIFNHGNINDSIFILNTNGLWSKSNNYSMFWFNENPTFIKYKFNNITDSIRIFNRDSVELKLNLTSTIEDYYFNKKIIINSNIPITDIEENLIYWKHSDQSINLSIIDDFNIQLDVAEATEAPQLLIINKGAINFVNNTLNDSSVFNFNYNENDYGTIHLKCETCSEKTIIELFNANQNTIIKESWKDQLKFSFITPGKYNLRIFEDLNGDFNWNSGKINPIKKPEPIKIYPEEIKIKANWEIDLIIE